MPVLASYKRVRSAQGAARPQVFSGLTSALAQRSHPSHTCTQEYPPLPQISSLVDRNQAFGLSVEEPDKIDPHHTKHSHIHPTPWAASQGFCNFSKAATESFIGFYTSCPGILLNGLKLTTFASRFLGLTKTTTEQ